MRLPISYPRRRLLACQEFLLLTDQEIRGIVATEPCQGANHMSCVVALIANGKLCMGADSASVSGSNINCRRDSKIFDRDGPNGETWMFGYVGSFRIGQLVHYELELPRLENPDRCDLHKFLVVKFIPLLRRCLRDGGSITRDDEGKERGTQLIIGLRGNIFLINYDFQVEELLVPYAALGIAQDLALGALYASSRMRDPEKRVLLALEAAQEFNSCVREPFITIETSFDT